MAKKTFCIVKWVYTYLVLIVNSIFTSFLFYDFAISVDIWWNLNITFAKKRFCQIITLNNEQFFLFEEKFFLSQNIKTCILGESTNLWHHHRHYCTLDVTLSVVSSEVLVVLKWNMVRFSSNLRQTFPTHF